MSAAVRDRSLRSVEPLLASLECSGLTPTIARNYEQFPDFAHDIDLFLRTTGHHPTPIFVDAAHELGWDFLTVCTHHWNITAYRFQHLDPPETMQVDVFGGMTLWGQTLASAEDLCRTRQQDPSGRFWHLNYTWQNGYRLFQIRNLLHAEARETEKIERYRRLALTFHEADARALPVWAGQLGLAGVEPALDALQARDYASFAKLVTAMMRRYLLRRMQRNPVASAREMFGRARHVTPCGPVLKLKATDRNRWGYALDMLVQARFLAGWTTGRVHSHGPQGARVVFCANGEPFADPETSVRMLAYQLVQRHHIAYSASLGA